ncbi:hypothetical protein L1987_57101 [Smallanthus sonchifolius]|uniref:Uncharacterized protein n=1 Tax=Smallanthus sonchifolius TaxID=185202 RepID=A0ACB9DBN9_9ASTR|nr:hypothetical protein L1987_57101 [Smallanthus sonchifolius]
MSGEGKVVCVTGASGYIASWLVKLLLDRGYTVHATVRSLASPVHFSVDDPQAQLLNPAVKGTRNVLKSAAKVQSIKRVVLTSSMAAVAFGSRLRESGDVVDETWFSDPLVCEQKKLWYHLSKTLAEDAAVKFAKENGFELVVINPGYVIGSILQPTLNFTSEGIMSLIKNGKEVFSDEIYRLVDVRDVAIAHILAFENPEANGRYCLVGKVVRSLVIMKIADKLYPSLDHSDRCKDGKCVEPPYNVSMAKAESLGVCFTPLEVSIKDTVESLKEKNLRKLLEH